MTAESHLRFNFVRPNIGEANDLVQLESNIIAWMNHAFLEIGGWINVTTGTTQHFGGNPSILRPLNEPNYVAYTVYQSFRKDWVYENPSSISYPSGEPIVCSGIYVNNTFYPTSTTTGTYAHIVNFPAGHIRFTNGGVSGVTVKAEYSYRTVQITKGDQADFNNFEMLSNRADNTQFLQFGSGKADVGWENRLQMPGVLITMGSDSKTPYALGTLQQNIQQKMNIYVFAEDKFWRDQLASILSWQADKAIYMMDFNSIARSGHYPLNIYGSINPSGRMYPDLIQTTDQGGHRYNRIIFKDLRTNTIQKLHKNLFIAHLTTNLEYLMVLPPN